MIWIKKRQGGLEKKLIFIFGGWVGHKMEALNASILKQMEATGFKHYKARAECFADIIDAFTIAAEHHITLFSPTFIGTPMGDAYCDFWTNNIHELKVLWDTEGRDLHRIIQTIKPIEEYDGKVDLSFWDKDESK